MRWRSLPFLVACALASAWACSSFDEAPGPGGSDGGPDTAIVDAPIDTMSSSDVLDSGPPPGKPCDPKGIFTTKQKLDGVSTVDNELSARLTPDERTVYFHRTSGGVTTIRRATRKDRDASFDNASIVTELGNTAAFASPAPDELTIFFSRGDPTVSIFVARRNLVTDAFGTATPLSVGPAGGQVTAPFFAPSSRMLYYQTTGITGSTYDIASTSIAPDGAAGDSGSVAQLNTTSWDGEAVLSADEKTVYFYSGRDRGDNTGAIYVAYRDTPTSTFRSPVIVAELEPTSGSDYTDPSWLSPDNCRLYYYTNSEYAQKGTEIWVAERLPPP